MHDFKYQILWFFFLNQRYMLINRGFTIHIEVYQLGLITQMKEVHKVKLKMYQIM